MKTQTRILEFFEFAVQEALSRHQLQCMTSVEPTIVYTADHLVARLHAYVTSEKMGTRTVELTVHERHSRPLTWWDQFKEEHPWINRWFYDFIEPPKYKHEYKTTTKSVTLEARALFPHYAPPKGFSPHTLVLREIEPLDYY